MLTQAIERLRFFCDTIPGLLAQIDELDFSYKPHAAKWSKKEVVGHLIDSATNNHHRWVRAQFEEQPHIVYNQNQWNACNYYQQMDSRQVIAFWLAYNRQLLALLRLMPEAALAREVNTGGASCVTIAFLVNDYVVHLEHHLRQIVEY